ncbi:SMI1/KNR4 family protein [Winogradskyella sp.]|uniref:SMI1/KNR4 family protein n=1 Tax=Winogradskyella sp. TaxID=1883156 RepID=UPI003BABCBC7
MTIPEKLEKISDWTFNNYILDSEKVSKNVETDLFGTIGNLLEEDIPKEFIELYSQFNGEEEGDGTGSLLGLQFMDLKSVISDLEFSRRMIKPKGKKLEESETTRNIISKIVNYFLFVVPKDKNWKRLELECSPISLGGPYLYLEKNEERIILKFLEDSDIAFELCKELHQLEKDIINWDKLEFVIYPSGQFDMKRIETNWDEIMDFESFPNKSVRLKYFHYKWLPIFTDGSGNFIGMDLDPDENGKKGQIIIYGRDERVLAVISENLDAFLEFILHYIDTNPDILLTENHIHEIFKHLVGAPHELLE